MRYLKRIEKAKRLLAITKKVGSLDLKYGTLNQSQAWEQFFQLFILRFKQLHKITITGEMIPIQWKALSDIYQFLDDTVIKFSETVTEFRFLISKYGDADYQEHFKKNYSDVLTTISAMKSESRICKQIAIRHQILENDLFKKYDKYLDEILKLTPESLFDDYFFKGTIPLDSFDEECVEKEGDPIKNLQITKHT